MAYLYILGIETVTENVFDLADNIRTCPPVWFVNRKDDAVGICRHILFQADKIVFVYDKRV